MLSADGLLKIRCGLFSGVQPVIRREIFFS